MYSKKDFIRAIYGMAEFDELVCKMHNLGFGTNPLDAAFGWGVEAIAFQFLTPDEEDERIEEVIDLLYKEIAEICKHNDSCEDVEERLGKIYDELRLKYIISAVVEGDNE